MWVILGIAGVVTLSEAVRQFLNRPSKQRQERYEEARQIRVKRFCLEGDDNGVA
jgi:hypothetical protein